MIRTLFTTALIVATGCTKRPCPDGQEFAGANHEAASFLEGEEVPRARGCRSRLPDGGALLQGRWSFFNLDGEKIAEGDFRDGSLGADQRPGDDDVRGREGTWLLEPRHTATFTNGVRDGEETWWFPPEAAPPEHLVTWKAGLREGLERTWFSTGQLERETFWVRDHKEGTEREWFENGQVAAVRNFHDGVQQGHQTLFHPNGVHWDEAEYVAGGREDQSTAWYDDGAKMAETHYVGDKESGVARRWTREGTLEEEAHYRDGEWDGLVTDYLADGGVSGRTNYRKGEHHGRRELWHPNGRKWVDAIYDGGVLVKGRAWNEDGKPEPLD